MTRYASPDANGLQGTHAIPAGARAATEPPGLDSATRDQARGRLRLEETCQPSCPLAAQSHSCNGTVAQSPSRKQYQSGTSA